MKLIPRVPIVVALLLLMLGLALAPASTVFADDLEVEGKLEVEKKVSADGDAWEDADNPAHAVLIEEGQLVHWLIKVEYEGKGSLPVTISDTLDGQEIDLEQECGTDPSLVELTAEDGWTCEFTTPSADGLFANIVTVTHTPLQGAEKTWQDTAYYVSAIEPPPQEHHIKVEKKVSADGEKWKDADEPEDALYVEKDQPVFWQIKVEFAGPGTLPVTISDVLPGEDIDLAEVCSEDPPTELVPGHEWECDFNTTAQAGIHGNIVTVTHTSQSGQENSWHDAAYYVSGTPPPAADEGISVDKQVSADGGAWYPADGPDDAIKVVAGSDVHWSITVENTGQDTLTVNILDKFDADDFELPADACENPAGVVLNPGDKYECEFTTVAKLGKHVNAVFASAEVAPALVGSWDLAWYLGMPEQALDHPEGCGQGYWKNHLLAWDATGYAPGDLFDEVFDGNVDVTSSFGEEFTLLEALRQGGGAEMTLGRKAVTALLNAAHPDVDYPMSVDEVKNMVQEAYESGEYAPVHVYFGTVNDGYCPLGNDEDKPDNQPGVGTHRFWLRYQNIWPLSDLFVGQKRYTKQEALTWMHQVGDTPDEEEAAAAAVADVSVTLFTAAVAGQLNVAAGNDASCVEQTLTAADEWLAANPAGSGVAETDAAAQEAISLYDALNAYNRGELCAPAVVDPAASAPVFLPLLAGG